MNLVVLFISITGRIFCQDKSFDKIEFIFHQNLNNYECFEVGIGDVNGDGFNDYVLANYQGQSQLWINDGNGNLSFTGQNFGNGYSHGCALGDLDGDLDLDLFLVATDDIDRIYFNDGLGNFTNSGQAIGDISDLSTQVLLADVDSDNDLDALITQTFHSNKIWWNNGEGMFTEYSELGDTVTYFMDIADIDGDLDKDIYIEYRDAKDKILINDGNGNYSVSQELGNESGNGNGRFSDLNNDSFPDLFITNSVEGNSVWLNNGSGYFAMANEYFGSGYRAALFDVDSDGDIDAITFHFENPCYLFLNDGNALFESYGEIFQGEICWNISSDDVDYDGDKDIILGNTMMNGGAAKLFLNESQPLSIPDKKKVKNEVLRIFPNPSTETHTIQVLNQQGISGIIEIFRINGEMVDQLFKGKIPDSNFKIQWNSDSYKQNAFICLYRANGEVYSTIILSKNKLIGK